MNPLISPFTIAAYSIGFVLAIPTLIAMIRFIFAVAQFVQLVKSTVQELTKLTATMVSFRHDIRDQLHWHDLRITRAEDQLGLGTLPPPERRT